MKKMYIVTCGEIDSMEHLEVYGVFDSREGAVEAVKNWMHPEFGAPQWVKRIGDITALYFYYDEEVGRNDAYFEVRGYEVNRLA